MCGADVQAVRTVTCWRASCLALGARVLRHGAPASAFRRRAPASQSGRPESAPAARSAGGWLAIANARRVRQPARAAGWIPRARRAWNTRFALACRPQGASADRTVLASPPRLVAAMWPVERARGPVAPHPRRGVSVSPSPALGAPRFRPGAWVGEARRSRTGDGPVSTPRQPPPPPSGTARCSPSTATMVTSAAVTGTVSCGALRRSA